MTMIHSPLTSAASTIRRSKVATLSPYRIQTANQRIWRALFRFRFGTQALAHDLRLFMWEISLDPTEETMADQKNRGGQKQGNTNPQDREKHQAAKTDRPPEGEPGGQKQGTGQTRPEHHKK